MTYVYPVVVADRSVEIVMRYALESEKVEYTRSPLDQSWVGNNGVVVTDEMLSREDIRRVIRGVTSVSPNVYMSQVNSFRVENDGENCQYCGQLYPREKFYGGCPSCGAPHE